MTDKKAGDAQEQIDKRPEQKLRAPDAVDAINAGGAQIQTLIEKHPNNWTSEGSLFAIEDRGQVIARQKPVKAKARSSECNNEKSKPSESAGQTSPAHADEIYNTADVGLKAIDNPQLSTYAQALALTEDPVLRAQLKQQATELDKQEIYREYIASNPAENRYAASERLPAIKAGDKPKLEGYLSEPENTWQAFRNLPPDQQQDVVEIFENASQVGQDSIAQQAQDILRGKPILDFVLAVDRAVRGFGTGVWKQELGHFCDNLSKVATGQPVGVQSQIEKAVTVGSGVLVKGAQGVDEIGQHAHPRAFVNDTHQAAEAMRQGIGEAGQYYKQRILNNDLGSIPGEVDKAVNYAREKANTAIQEFPDKDASEQANTLGSAATVVFILAATRELITAESAKKMGLFNLTDEELEAKGIQRKNIKDIPPEDIVNPLDRVASGETKIAQLKTLSYENQPLIQSFTQNIDTKFGTKSSQATLKADKDIADKAVRPDIRKTKEWFDIEHVRDSLRFKTPVNDLKLLPEILKELKKSRFEIINPDMDKLLEPKARGWRMAAFDLRAPNGQIIEYQILPQEMNEAGAIEHSLYKHWRGTDISQLTTEQKIARQKADLDAARLYETAWHNYLNRTGQTENNIVEFVETTRKALEQER